MLHFLKTLMSVFFDCVFGSESSPRVSRPAVSSAAKAAVPVCEKSVNLPVKRKEQAVSPEGETAAAKSGPAELHEEVKSFLFSKYDFRFNVLTEQVEYRVHGEVKKPFRVVDRRTLNTLVIEVREEGLNCWDKDVERLLRSHYVANFHPFYAYMEGLPTWDGVDRIGPLALRVDDDAVWVNGFHRWMLALTAQWMGRKLRCANTLTPLLLSERQGLAKSTFCRLLMPKVLEGYYLDKFDLNARSGVEQKLGQFGLINLDEFDRYSDVAVASLKNLVQLKELTVRRAYASYYRHLGRIASFIGTSNQMELLNDPSGSRRFLCVEVKHVIDCSPIDHDQIFAQLKSEVLAGERVWMTEEEERLLQEHNCVFKRLHPEKEVFLRLFSIPEREGEGHYFSAAEIFRRMCKCNAAAMRGVNVIQLGRTLSDLGLKRVRTRYGNRYLVGEVEMGGRL